MKWSGEQESGRRRAVSRIVFALNPDMPDERAESIAQGIAAPEESRVGKDAEARLQEEMKNMPEELRPDGAMGGTSDVDAPVDDAEMLRARNEPKGER